MPQSPEPASAILRRLHREATLGPWSCDDDDNPHLVNAGRDEGGAFAYVADMEWDATGRCEENTQLVIALRNALPALADLVKWCEEERIDHTSNRHREFTCECKMCRALAGLREVLNANVP